MIRLYLVDGFCAIDVVPKTDQVIDWARFPKVQQAASRILDTCLEEGGPARGGMQMAPSFEILGLVLGSSTDRLGLQPHPVKDPSEDQEHCLSTTWVRERGCDGSIDS